MKKIGIIGGGTAGVATAYEFYKKNNWEIQIFEKGSKLGAGVRTEFRSGHPHTYGPRHFLTHKQETFEYMNNIVPLRLCKEHQFMSFVSEDSNFYSYPIHEDDIKKMPDKNIIYSQLDKLDNFYKNKEFKLQEGNKEIEDKANNYEEFWINSIGQNLYNKFILNYTKKMWQVDDNKIIDDFTWSPKGVAIKKGSREGWDTAISAYPISINGYNDFFDKIFDKAKVNLNTEITEVNYENNDIKVDNEWHNFDVIINTTPIDYLFNYCFGELKYIGRDITFIILPVENALPKDVYFTYYCGQEKFTRVVEYKKFTKYQSPHTLISIEYPSSRGRLYPMPIKEEKLKAQKYFNLQSDNMFSIGRIGAFNYRYDIDDAIEQAIEVAKRF